MSSHVNEIVFIQNEKVKLCVPTRSHLPFFLKWFNDLEVTVFLGQMFPQLEMTEERWLEKHSDDSHNFVFVLHTPNSVPIGTMGLHQVDYINRTAMTGACIGEKEYWGKGYGTAAKMLLLDWAFNRLNLYAIRSSYFAFNPRSGAYNAKCGYKEVGRYPQFRERNGKRHDEILMVVTREDFSLIAGNK